MKHIVVRAVAGLLLLACGALTGRAQVERVELKIDGYLCGN
jgi:hypothetical protein